MCYHALCVCVVSVCVMVVWRVATVDTVRWSFCRHLKLILLYQHFSTAEYFLGQMRAVLTHCTRK